MSGLAHSGDVCRLSNGALTAFTATAAVRVSFNEIPGAVSDGHSSLFVAHHGFQSENKQDIDTDIWTCPARREVRVNSQKLALLCQMLVCVLGVAAV
jgi:hypothetical protein